MFYPKPETNHRPLSKSIEERHETINKAVQKLLMNYPVTSITADNGSEFSLLSDLEGIDIYFAHPYSSYECDTNDGLLREFLPKGLSLNPLTTEKLDKLVSAISNRPRRPHHYKTANFLFGLAQTA